MSLFGGRGGDVSRTGADGSGQGSSSRASRRPGTGAGGEQMANIGKSIAIKGDLTGNEDLEIEGTVDGRVELPNNQLTIGANGSVQAELKAKVVVVVGRVTGNVHGTERVEVEATGVVDGDVTAPKLAVAEGARINGAIHMTDASSGRASGALKTA